MKHNNLSNNDSDASAELGITDWDCGDSGLTPEKIASGVRDSDVCLYCAIKNLGQDPYSWNERSCNCRNIRRR